MSLLDLLRCPACSTSDLDHADDRIRCRSCGADFTRRADIGFAAMIPGDRLNAAKQDIQKWWGDLYAQLYRDTDAGLTQDGLVRMVDEFEELMRLRRHLAAVEMPLAELNGKTVLEIGPGGGGHSCLFKKYGARMVAADITPERAVSTAGKLALMPGEPSLAVNADGENLPFQDDSFDIVYSNGVLHHSQDTGRCIAEVLRVLKPGGKAVIMLYSRHSAVFWLNILPRAVVTGEIFRWPEAEWVGRVTEGKPKFGQTKNPFTRVYSEREIRQAFAAFTLRGLRKSSFQFDNIAIPRMTQARKWLLSRLGCRPHPGGVLVYGAPFVPETVVELALGPVMGWAWNVLAEKPL